MSEIIGHILMWANFGLAAYWVFCLVKIARSKRQQTDTMPMFEVLLAGKYLIYTMMCLFCGSLCMLLLLR